MLCDCLNPDAIRIIHHTARLINARSDKEA